MSVATSRQRARTRLFLLQVIKGLALAITICFGTACGSGGESRPCDGVTCDGGTCISDETGVRCECAPGACQDQNDPLHCIPCSDADGDGDTDSDSDGDIDGDVDGDEDTETDHPTITGISGTGSVSGIGVDPEELSACRELPAERVPADQRVDNLILVNGTNLGDVTEARSEGLCGQGTLVFGHEVVSMSMVLLRLPAELTITAGGLFLLTLVTPLGTAEAQLFILRGEDGEDCASSILEPDEDGTYVLAGDLRVEGNLEVTESGTFGTVTVLQSVWLPECPPGYERDTRRDIVLCTNGHDEMVKVGDFWVDRYEASVWADADCTTGIREHVPYGSESTAYTDAFPFHGQIYNFEDQLFACSVSDVRPSRWLTWFQAQSACAASGKHLITNAEWQAAVVGTVDPRSITADVGACRTDAELSGPRPTGQAGASPGGEGSCISLWGAEDMIGNLIEWTADWYGQGGDSDDGFQPDEYFDDEYSNVDTAEGHGDIATSFPSAGLRGGSWENGTGAGAFSLDLTNSPAATNRNYRIGFRCARSF